MYTFRRNIRFIYPYFNIFIGIIVLFVGVILWGVYVNIVGVEEEISSGVYIIRNVSEEFGLIYSYVLVGVTGAIILLWPPSFWMRWREKSRYRKRYLKDFPIDKSRLYIYSTLVIMIVAVFCIKAVSNYLEWPDAVFQNVIRVGIFIFSVVYLIGVFAVSAHHYEDMLNHLNQHHENTQLNSNGFVGRRHVELEGLYHNKPIFFEFVVPEFSQNKRYSLPSLKSNKTNHIKIKCTFSQLVGGPQSEIRITENNHEWFSIYGESIDDCFQQRFNIDGVDISKLPLIFKEHLLNFHFPIELVLTEHKLIYQTDYDMAIPLYSGHEGMVLFWDELLLWFNTCSDGDDRFIRH